MTSHPSTFLCKKPACKKKTEAELKSLFLFSVWPKWVTALMRISGINGD